MPEWNGDDRRNGPTGREFGAIVSRLDGMEKSHDVIKLDIRRLFDKIESYHLEARDHFQKCPNTTPIKELDKRVDRHGEEISSLKSEVGGIRRTAAGIATAISIVLGFLGYIFKTHIGK